MNQVFGGWKTPSMKGVNMVFIILIPLFLIGLYSFNQFYREENSFSVLVFFCTIALGIMVYISHLLYQANVKLDASLAASKQRNSFEFLNSLRTTEIIDVRFRLDSKYNNVQVDSDYMYDEIISNRSDVIAVRAMLAIFNDMAVAVKQGHADEKIIYNSADTAILYTYDNFKPYIDAVRERRGEGVYATLGDMVQSWKCGVYFEDGSPLPNKK